MDPSRRFRSRRRGTGTLIVDRRIAGIACAFFSLFVVVQSAGAYLSPSPAGGGVAIAFWVFCAEIFLALAFGAAYLALLILTPESRALRAGSIWAIWLAMGVATFVCLPRLAVVLDRYEYGASLGTIVAATGMTAVQIERASTAGLRFHHSRASLSYEPPPARISTFAAPDTRAIFTHAARFEASTNDRGYATSIRIVIVPGLPGARESDAAIARTRSALAAAGWRETHPNVFSSGHAYHITLAREIVGHVSLDDPNSAPEYEVYAELAGP